MNKPTVKYNIAVVGATGLVGKRIIQFLESRNFPVNKLFCLASEKSMNTVIPFKSKMITVQNLKDFEFSFIHFTFFSAGSEVSKHYAPIAASYGSIVIDNTSYFRYENDIPLIIPEVNIEALSLYKKRRIIANPNCSTIQMLVALNPIHKQATLKRIEIATYQAVSGAGKKAMDELSHQTQCILDKK
ncbi:MAG: aspartate-semialdehyde dehydrogenase, partial [Endozoicomonadaceae bacterium]|nr:aspartate-semialdehyde dehydrogenase [Endozoicomonadaceae bacterium]